MTGNVIEIVVGAVVLVIAALFLFFAYTMSHVKQVEGYQVTAQFERVDGIRDGSDVRIAGVKVGTVTGVHPTSRYGEMLVRSGEVMEFNEKPTVAEGFVSGGFFVFESAFFRYLSPADDLFLEAEPLEQRRHMLANFRLRGAGDPQGQRHILGDAELVEQPKLLKHDADPPP